jgi:transposase
MWTLENRPRYDRDKLRYPSDLTDPEWQHIGPLLPPAKRGGSKRTVDMREVVSAGVDQDAGLGVAVQRDGAAGAEDLLAAAADHGASASARSR